MAIDAYVLFGKTIAGKKDITVVGETSDAAFSTQGAIEIIDFKWNVSSVSEEKSKKTSDKHETPSDPKAKLKVGTSGSAKHRVVNVSSCKISKPFDVASLGLFRACLDTECVFEDVQVIFRKTGSDATPMIYLTFKFGNVRVDSVDWGLKSVDQSDAKPDQEDVSLSFETCMITYLPQKKSGSEKASKKMTANYDKNELAQQNASGGPDDGK